jgi:hypothetical protein
LTKLRDSKERYADILMNSSSGHSSPMLNSHRLLDDRPNLLKHSQVLELTSNTLPRMRSSTAPRIDLVNYTPHERKDSMTQSQMTNCPGYSSRKNSSSSKSRPLSTGYITDQLSSHS